MKIFKRYSQDQNFLLPPSLDEFVPEDHEVHIINEVVDTLDLSPLLSRYEGGGAPAYHPAMMLKVIIYAYSLGIYSSRRIAQELKTDTAFMFLSGLQAPDFRTICLFRAQHAAVLPDLFVEVVRLCASLGMVELGHIAFDGTKLRANAALRQSRNKDGLEKEIEHIKEEVTQMIEASARIDEIEEQKYPDGDGSEIAKELRKKEYRLKKLREAREMLEQEKLERVNATDPDSRLMQDSRRVIQPSYNGQIAVDEKEQVIVAADVSQNTTDHHEFEQMLEQVEQNLGALPKEASADAGYSSYENLEYAQQKGLDAYMPDDFFEALDKKEQAEKRYHKSNFRYNQSRDVYICPEGRNLRRFQELKRQDKPPLIIYRGESCRRCAVKRECTRGPARRITRDGREGLLEAMREKLRSEEGKEIYKKRLYTVEPVLGDIKWNRRKLMMSLRGLEKVRGEFCLMCLVHNVKKIVKRVFEGYLPRFGWRKASQVALPGHRSEEMTLVGAQV
jgi:transposase